MKRGKGKCKISFRLFGYVLSTDYFYNSFFSLSRILFCSWFHNSIVHLLLLDSVVFFIRCLSLSLSPNFIISMFSSYFQSNFIETIYYNDFIDTIFDFFLSKMRLFSQCNLFASVYQSIQNQNVNLLFIT